MVIRPLCASPILGWSTERWSEMLYIGLSAFMLIIGMILP